MSSPKSAYSIPTKKGKLDTHIFVVWVDNEVWCIGKSSWFIFWKRIQY